MTRRLRLIFVTVITVAAIITSASVENILGAPSFAPFAKGASLRTPSTSNNASPTDPLVPPNYVVGARHAVPAPPAPPHVLAIYTDKGEQDHIDFANQAIKFFSNLAKQKGFAFESTTNWDSVTPEKLKDTQLVLWLNDFPHTPDQCAAFEGYMKTNGAWLGFHVAAYNDDSTNWPWFVDFLGGAVFFGNNWPPLPAKLKVDDSHHPVTQGLPPILSAPANEWYIWKPSPRLNKDVKVLLTLDPSNYPIGLKDTITSGDCPVVWTNTRYKMLYINMGHGDKIFTTPDENHLFENAVLWLLPHP